MADLIVPEGVTIKTDLNHPVATVFEPSALQAANEDAGGDAKEPAPAAEGETPAAEATQSEDKKA